MIVRDAKTKKPIAMLCDACLRRCSLHQPDELREVLTCWTETVTPERTWNHCATCRPKVEPLPVDEPFPARRRATGVMPW